MLTLLDRSEVRRSMELSSAAVRGLQDGPDGADEEDDADV